MNAHLKRREKKTSEKYMRGEMREKTGDTEAISAC